MPTREWNRRMWNDPANWKDGGDEWHFHAAHSRQPYEAWKRSVATTFIDPYLGPDVDMLELGAGHGRWGEFMLGRVRSLTLVDLNDSCIDACRQRFGSDDASLRYVVNDGRTLPVADESVDVIWSFATLVHVDEADIDSYLGEFRRVLRPHGRFVVHHAGWLEWHARFLGHISPAVRARLATGHWRGRNDRSVMSAGRFADLAAHHGLRVDQSTRSWGARGQFRLASGDTIASGCRTEGIAGS